MGSPCSVAHLIVVMTDLACLKVESCVEVLYEASLFLVKYLGLIHLSSIGDIKLFDTLLHELMVKNKQISTSDCLKIGEKFQYCPKVNLNTHN